MIETVLNNIDGQISTFAQSTYGNLAGEIGTLAAILGGVGFLILVINMIAQLMPMHGGAIFAWAVKFILVTAAASSWAFFEPIYAAVMALADGLSGLLLGGDSIAAGLQATVDVLWDNYDTLMRQSGLSNIAIGLAAVVVAGIAVVLTCAGIVVIGISKMGLAIALGFAPIFIICLLFKATSDLFGAWTKFTLSFVMMLVLTAGIIGILTQVLDIAVISGTDAETLEDMIAVLVISVATIFFLGQIPSYASALAGSIASAGVSINSAASRMAGGASSAAKGTASAANDAYTGSKVASAVMDAGRESKAQGGSLRDRGAAMLGEYTDIHNKARATTNSRLRGAAAGNSAARAKRNPPTKK